MRLDIVYSAIVFCALSAVSQANEVTPETLVNEAYFTIESVELEEVSGDPLETRASRFIKDPAPATISGASDWIGKILNPSKIATNIIVNIGKQLWTIVEANRPVIRVSQEASAHALPQGVQSWRELERWQVPASRAYRLSYKNAYGAKVVDFTYRILYTYGGSIGGVGQYLTQVSIIPAHVSVAWGYTFEAQASVPSVTNAGTVKEPVAAAQLQLRWAVSTVLKRDETTVDYYVRGDGYFQAL
jgi:hypothetical protein